MTPENDRMRLALTEIHGIAMRELPTYRGSAVASILLRIAQVADAAREPTALSSEDLCATCGHADEHHVGPQGEAPRSCVMCEADGHDDGPTYYPHPFVSVRGRKE